MRIREITDIRWTVLGKDDQGRGKILNISSSGLLLQTDENFNPRNQGTLFIDAPGAQPLEFGPRKGKVVWMRRLSEGRQGFQCGVEFIKNSADKPLEDWLDQKTRHLAEATDPNILNHYIF